MHVIASYKENRFDGWRNFELLPDRVIVKGKQSLGAEFESVVMLDTLQPVVSRFRARTKGFGQGIVMALASIALVQSGLVHPFSYWGDLVIIFGVSGALLSLTTARRVEWARINSKAGVLALTVARSGKKKAAFEPFVQRIIQQIQVSEATSGEGAPNYSSKPTPDGAA